MLTFRFGITKLFRVAGQVSMSRAGNGPVAFMGKFDMKILVVYEKSISGWELTPLTFLASVLPLKLWKKPKN